MKSFGKFSLVLLLLFGSIVSFAQEDKKKLNFEFYGFVRADYYYDSRQSVISNEGLLFLYPKDEKLDVNGEDLNAQANAGLYSFVTRPGVKISGLNVFNADLTGVVEADFAGYSGNGTLLRIRLAYMKFDWQKSSLLLGQGWHPMFTPVKPGQLSISTGAPFQAFNRSPQIRYNYKLSDLTLSGAAVFQYQYLSTGPDGKSSKYFKQALVPELALMADYRYSGFQAGLALSYLKIKPRTEMTLLYPGSSNTYIPMPYKINESVSSLSYSAYLSYTDRLFSATIRSSLMENPVHLNMLGGYGIKSVDQYGEREYTPFRHSSTWLNLSYGKKYVPNLFIGYTRNLGSKDELVDNTSMFGEGLSIQELYRVSPSISYNIPHFRLGLEYEFSLAKYGDSGTIDWKDGLYGSTHAVKNHRLMGTVSYIF